MTFGTTFVVSSRPPISDKNNEFPAKVKAVPEKHLEGIWKGVNVQLQSFLIFAVDEGEWLASLHDRFDLDKEPLVSTEYGASWGLEEGNISCPYRE